MDGLTIARAFLQALMQEMETEPTAARREWLSRVAGNVRKYIAEKVADNGR